MLLLRRRSSILTVIICHGLWGNVLIFTPLEHLSDVLLALLDLTLQADGIYFEEAYLVAYLLIYFCGGCTLSCV